MKLFFIYLYSIALMACSNHGATNSNLGKTLIDSTLTNQNTSKEELTKMYSQAIADYIKAVNKDYHLSFDTLFFGKYVYGQPDDFPDIALPKSIENTPIRLITPEVGVQLQKARKSLFYINLIGDVNDESAEFIFITFSNGCEHQFDYFINYKFNPKAKKFESENLRFENFLYKKE
jgi:hypothetical protein